MITGVVTANREATIRLVVVSAAGRQEEIEAIIDTGFTGFLTGLARLTGIPQATLSAIENDRVRLGVERAKVLARALKCHPAVLVFPGWEVARSSAA